MKTKKIEIKEDVMMLVRHVNFAVNLKPLLDKISELERLARIGKATEKAFESGFSINQMHSVLSNIDYCIYDKESLLNWAEEEVSND